MTYEEWSIAAVLKGCPLCGGRLSLLRDAIWSHAEAPERYVHYCWVVCANRKCWSSLLEDKDSQIVSYDEQLFHVRRETIPGKYAQLIYEGRVQ